MYLFLKAKNIHFLLQFFFHGSEPNSLDIPTRIVSSFKFPYILDTVTDFSTL